MEIDYGLCGNLERTNMAKESIGLDPLANKYLKLGTKNHKMNYVQAYSENIPFEKECFDMICSFNSLDHVEDLKQSVSEIKRVLKKGGLFLLIVDIHHYPTPT